MNQASPSSWEQANQAHLSAALAEVHAALAAFIASTDDHQNAGQSLTPPEPAQDSGAPMRPPPALETLCAAFGLSSFERKILLMCAGVELNSGFASLFHAASGDRRSTLPTFSLALSAFEDAHWSALLPPRPLRHWRLVELVSGETLTSSPLRIDERILHYLAGTSCVDERLRGLTEPVPTRTEAPASQNAVAEQIANSWSHSDGRAAWTVAQLCGIDPSGKRAVAAAACSMLGLNLSAIPANMIPRGAELELFVQIWEREAVLSPGALLVECDEMEPADAQGDIAFSRLVETIRSPLLLAVREPRKGIKRPLLTLNVPQPTSAEQRRIWTEALGSCASALNGSVDALVSQFSLSASSIHAAASAIGQEPAETDTVAKTFAPGLWDICRAQARPRMEGLAQRIEPIATWDDLVLPEKQKQLLRQITIHVRHRAMVYQTWGFASRSSRGHGISALFAGPSGTGKTMAGEVLANELRLDLYRVDLSRVVSKYIGETEKNLRQVFDAADEGGAILLFDEADALFGKRSEVKDSHDRYANIEVSYLLQRMEAYRGLAILTTNRREALDPAFLRRIRFAVEFSFPEAAQREEIWRRVFPAKTPTEGLRPDKLARLNAAGGNIHNIAVGAAFLAADAGEPVRMSHLLSAARSEFAKLERPLSDPETAGWV